MNRLLCVLLLLPPLVPATAQEWFPLDYDADAAPADNPLKGFIPYAGNYTFPHSMEFDYIGLDQLMTAMQSFTFEQGLEPLLASMAARGHQALLRVFIDYPGERNALPRFLSDAGVRQQRYFSDGGGRSPDYEHPLLVEALEHFIAAFGARYDGDPRIGFIQLGLLGHWGEWHTYPQEHLAPSRATQDRVLAAYDAAFDNTRLLVSQDLLGFAHPADLRVYDIGLHDDDFTNNTLPPGETQFWSRVLAQGLQDLWHTRVIGGEIQPDYQETIWNVPSGAPEDYFEAVQTTHASWLLNHAAFENRWPESKRARARAAAKALGYEFHIPAASLLLGEDNLLMVDVQFENTGSAPFYYDWPVQIAILREDGVPVLAQDTGWAISAVLPGFPPVEYAVELDCGDLAGGIHDVALRVQNPLENGRRLRFANAEQGACWLILGSIVLPENPAPGDLLPIAGCPPEGGEGGEVDEEEKFPVICGETGNDPSRTVDDALVLGLTLLALCMSSSRGRTSG